MERKSQSALTKIITLILILVLALSLVSVEANAVTAKNRVQITSLYSTPTGMKITYRSVPKTKYYSVYRKIGTGSYKYLGKGSDNCFYDRNAVYGKKYTYKLIAVNKNGSKANWNTKTATCKQVIKPKITKIAINEDKGGIDLKWSSVPGATKYKIYRGVWVPIGENRYVLEYKSYKTVSGKTTFRDANVSPDNNYYYKIRAYRNSKASADSTSKNLYYNYDANVFDKAPQLNATIAPDSGNVTLNWRLDGKVDGYLLLSRENLNEQWTQFGDYDAGATLQYNGRQLSGAMYYAVIGYKTMEDGSKRYTKMSEPVRLSWLENVKPTVYVNEKTGSGTLNWNAVNGATRYTGMIIFVSRNDASLGSVSINTGSSNFTFKVPQGTYSLIIGLQPITNSSDGGSTEGNKYDGRYFLSKPFGEGDNGNNSGQIPPVNPNPIDPDVSKPGEQPSTGFNGEIQAEKNRYNEQRNVINKQYDSKIDTLEELLQSMMNKFGVSYVNSVSYYDQKSAELKSEIERLSRKIALMERETYSNKVELKKLKEERESLSSEYEKVLSLRILAQKKDEIENEKVQKKIVLGSMESQHRENVDAICQKYGVSNPSAYY